MTADQNMSSSDAIANGGFIEWPKMYCRILNKNSQQSHLYWIMEKRIWIHMPFDNWISMYLHDLS